MNSVEGDHSEGLINVSGNNVGVPVNVCHNQVPVNVVGVQVPLNSTDIVLDLAGGLGLGLLGDGEGKAKDGNTTLDESCNAESTGDAVLQNAED